MKRLLKLLLIFSSVIGISFLLFVVRMVWFPPSSMGMMMGRNMMFHHMYFYFTQMFWISLIILGVALLIWLIKRKTNNKKSN